MQSAQPPPEGLGNSEQQVGHTHSAEHDRASIEGDSGCLSTGGFQQLDVETPSFPARFQVHGNSQEVDARDNKESRQEQHQQEKPRTVQSPGSVRGRQETDDWRQEQRLWLTPPSGLSETAGLQLKPESAANTVPPSRAESRISAGDRPAGLESRTGWPQRPAKVRLPRCPLAWCQHPQHQATHERIRGACRPRHAAALSASAWVSAASPAADELIAAYQRNAGVDPTCCAQWNGRACHENPVHDTCSCR